MKPLPANVLVAALLCLASALFGLIQGTPGLEFHEYAVPSSVALVLALLHVYCAFGLLGGSNFARSLTLWLLGIGFLLTWVALWRDVRAAAAVGVFAGSIVKLFFVAFFLWHLSSPPAVGYTGGGHAHADEHGGHAHA